MSGKSERQRMQELMDGFEQKGAILKKEEEQQVDSDSLNEAYKTLQKNAFQKDEQLSEMSSSPGRGYAGSAGETVNSIIDTQEDVKQQKYGMSNNKMPAAQSGLTPREALEIAVKRTVESGDPVNGIAFYDEVNWNLSKMGFNPKAAIDIKSALGDIIKYGEIRD